MRLITSTLAALIAALALAACGGGSETTAEIPGGADPAAVQVIDDWAHTLSKGDVDGAAAYFAIPSIAQNGPTLKINNLADAKLFNASLPCGALLTEATTDGEFTIATFRLAERPGAGVCDAAAEAEAQTAFKIEDGEIVEWRRVLPGGEDGGGPAAPQSSA